MFKTFRWRTVAVSLIVLAVPALLLANHSWSNYHWARTNNPFTLKLGDNVSAVWDPYLAETSTDWTKSTVLNTTVVSGQASKRSCPATLGRVEVCNNRYGYNGWLGVATIWLSGGHISQGTVKVNDSYFDTNTYNTPAWRRFVMCQEVGHTFGLDHQDENFSNYNLGTCMDYTNAPAGGGTYGPSNEQPNQHDYDQLKTIYQHLDSTTTVGAALPSAMNDIDLAGPGQWGRVIAGSRAKGFTVHELDFGHGNKIITHVLWVSDKHIEQ